MRKTLLDYKDPNRRSWRQFLTLPEDEGERDQWVLDASRLRFARHVVNDLEDTGYTTHADVVLDHLAIHEAGVQHALLFPPHRPAPGTELVLVGGPAHGEVRRVGVDSLAAILVVPQGAPAHVYVFAGLNVATGAWEWTDGGEA